MLESESHIIIKYESNLTFASGTDVNTASNILVPAVAKHAEVGILQPALDPMDVFDVDTVDPQHTGAVKTAAHAV